jgi:uncharacterized repeat protein (TIGR01451 family)
LGVLVALAVPGALLALPAASLALPPVALTVNDATDAPLANPAGIGCVSTDSGGCTLRAAVQAADNAGGGTITVPGGDFKLTIAATAGGGADDPSTGDLDVTAGTTLTITGAGASSTIIDGTHLDRAFAVHAGASLSISAVTVQNGSQPNTAPSNNSVSPGHGGAFYNDGSLSISSSVLSNNSAVSGGGVVFSDTAATATSITNSTVTGNTADSYGGVVYALSGSVAFSGDTVTHNSADSYGGILYGDDSGNTVGAVTVSASTVSNNVADDAGGAFYLDDVAALSVSASTFDDDSTDDSDGGAIEDDTSGPLTVTASTFAGDSAGDDDGGAIYTDAADLSAGGVSGSTFTDDEGDEGGAIYLDGSTPTSTELITTSTFANNDATDDDGGAIYDDKGNLTLTSSTFTGNNSSYYGGALYYDSSDGLVLTNDTFDGNQAVEGGGIYLDGVATTGTVVILNNTITRNSAYDGGGIYEPAYANTIENTIVSENSGGSGLDGGGDCYGTAATDNAGAADKGGNIDGDGTCFLASVSHDLINTNADLGVLASNGGAMQTDALLAGSPAIGHAVNTPVACPTTDERGVTRPAACDIGAFQTSTADMSISMSGPATAAFGAPLSYTLTITNNGPAPATGVSVSDTLPAGTTYAGASASQGTCSGTTTVTCSLGTLNSIGSGPSNAATITIVAFAGTAGTLTNTATVSANETDPNHANNTATVSTTVAPAIATAAATTLTTLVGVSPVVLSTGAYHRTATSAKLNGMVNTAGEVTRYRFQFGKSKRYGRTSYSGTLAGGSRQIRVVIKVKRLKPLTTYHYRVVATNATGTTSGRDMTFKTRKRPAKQHAG